MLPVVAFAGSGSEREAAAEWEDAPLALFLLLGQSNMAGRGVIEARDREPHPRIFMLDAAREWRPAIDPVHFDKPAIAGVGPASAFAHVLAEVDPRMHIGLVPAAMGGSSLDDWHPEGPLFAEAMARARSAAKRGRIAGILWHQGEADSTPERAATYAARFAHVVERIRAELGSSEIPVIVGETGRFRAGSDTINTVLAALPASVPRCAFVSAEELSDKGDKVHFDAPSLRELGRRYARAWLALERR